MKRLSILILTIISTLLTSGIAQASSEDPCKGTDFEGIVQLTKFGEKEKEYSSCEFWVLPINLWSGANTIPQEGMCAKVEIVKPSVSLDTNQNYRLSICAILSSDSEPRLVIRGLKISE